jgi:hypothetical protein
MTSAEYRIHEDLNLIEVCYEGIVEIADVESYVEEVLKRRILTEGMVEYVDLSRVTDLKGDYPAACGLTDMLLPWISQGWRGSVFFTPRDQLFGMVRMLDASLAGAQQTPTVALIARRQATPLCHVRQLLLDHEQGA